MLSFIKNSFLNEYKRWVLWLPVFQAVGIIFYFSLPTEPSTIATASLLSSVILLFAAFWRRSIWRITMFALLFATIGFSAAKIRAELVNAPKIPKETFLTISGNIEEIAYNEQTPRLLLNNLRIDELPAEKIPSKIRITVRTKIKGDIAPGDRVITDAILLPPPEPVLPNSYDFSQWAYFQQIGATGYAVKTVVKLKEGGIANSLNGLRFNITKFIKDNSSSEQAGAITAALITGERSGISEEVNNDMRNSGLAHILSISGLHLSLVSGFFFVLIRYGLGFIGGFSERINIKKLAAAISILGSFGYLLISGMPSPAVRSFLMIFLLLLSVLIDRTPTPMRSVAFAAFIILLVAPESILNPGFQMSFMAVIALLSVYEFIATRWRSLFDPESEKSQSKLRQSLRGIITYPLGIVITSVFAGLATTPFAAYHFNQYAAYGLLANLLAMPLSSFWIMPMAVFAFILAPFGLGDEAIWVMSKGVEVLIQIAHYVSSLEGATGVWKSFSASNLALISIGMLWFFIWQKPWRLLGLLPIALGAFLATQTPTPDIIIAGNAKLWAINFPDGLQISNRRKTFASEQWYKSLGQKDFLKLPMQDIYELKGKTVSFNCSQADIIFDLVKPRKPRKNSKKPAEVKKPCTKKLTLTENQITNSGTHTLYIKGSNILIENVEQFRGDRLWTK